MYYAMYLPHNNVASVIDNGAVVTGARLAGVAEVLEACHASTSCREELQIEKKGMHLRYSVEITR